MEGLELFYSQRDLRTEEYLKNPRVFQTMAITVVVEPRLIGSRAGQLCALALLNQLARVHRSITLVAEKDAALLFSPHFGGKTFLDEAATVIRETDPYASFSIVDKLPKAGISISIGSVIGIDTDFYLGANVDLATVSQHPALFRGDESELGAALAASLGAAHVLKRALGMECPDRSISAWTFTEVAAPQLKVNPVRPFDVGNGLMLGAGAVASGLAYWCRALGTLSRFHNIDRDGVELSNTNRGMTFTAKSAGWGGHLQERKVDNLARFLPAGTVAIPLWFHEWKNPGVPFDFVLCLANEYGVRPMAAQLQPTVLLHATTGPDWNVLLHRHIAGRDDCIACRLPETKQVRMKCSGGEVVSEGTKTDAAMPFLSATAGLMLYVALLKLECGELEQGEVNEWRIFFDDSAKCTQFGMRRCVEGCVTRLPPVLRAKLNDQSRWAHLDPEAGTK